MALIFKEQFRILDSDSKYLRRKSTGEIFIDGLFLGKNDLPENYEEISEEEYNQFLQEQEAERQKELEKSEEEIRNFQEEHENDPQPDVTID